MKKLSIFIILLLISSCSLNNKDTGTTSNQINQKKEIGQNVEKDLKENNLDDENPKGGIIEDNNSIEKTIEVLKPEIRKKITTGLEIQNKEIKTEEDKKEIEDIKQEIEKEIISITDKLDIVKTKDDKEEIKKLQKEVRILKQLSRTILSDENYNTPEGHSNRPMGGMPGRY